MTVTKNADGTFSVQFLAARELEVLVGVLGLTRGDYLTAEASSVGYPVFEQLQKALEADGRSTNPFGLNVANPEHPEMVELAIQTIELMTGKEFDIGALDTVSGIGSDQTVANTAPQREALNG
jgi:hypothetical protein